MRDVRTQLDAAKADYRSAKYPGDLAGELLPAPPRRWYLTLQPWLTPIAGGAIAAVVILAVWKPSQNDRGRNPSNPPTPIMPPAPVVQVTPPQPWQQTAVESLKSVPVEAYVMDVKTGVRQA